MSYCTIHELQSFTGTTLDDNTLNEFILQCDREVNAYLSPRGVTGSVTDDTCKAAGLKLAMANLFNARMMFPRQPMGYNTAEPQTSDPVGVAIQLRKEAFQLLDLYIQNQPVLVNNKRPYIVKVNGR
jgi:hypothetical protein